MIQTNNEHQNELRVITHTSSEYLEGNIRYVSISQILCEAYEKFLNVNMKFSKSLSYSNCNVLIENFPILTYGINVVKRSNVHIFLKKFSQLDKETSTAFPSDLLGRKIQNLEEIILTDLQLFLSYINYYKIISSQGRMSNLLKFLFQPVLTFKTYLNDRMVLKEINEKFEIKSNEQVYDYIHGINRKMELFLKEVGGAYCTDKKRKLNSIDLVIYSAYKAQEKVLGIEYVCCSIFIIA